MGFPPAQHKVARKSPPGSCRRTKTTSLQGKCFSSVLKDRGVLLAFPARTCSLAAAASLQPLVPASLARTIPGTGCFMPKHWDSRHITEIRDFSHLLEQGLVSHRQRHLLFSGEQHPRAAAWGTAAGNPGASESMRSSCTGERPKPVR